VSSIRPTLQRLARLERRSRVRLLSFLLVSAGKLRRPARWLNQATQDDMIFQHNVAKWFRDHGDATLRVTYPELNESSVVLDLGGYKGQFAADIYSRYCCRVFVFEPFSGFFNVLQERFRGNDQIHLFDFGLGPADEFKTIFYQDDATSIFRETKNYERIHIKCFATFLAENGIDAVDLMKINIEGSEYDLLEHIISNDLQKRIRNIQVQFHRDIDHAYERMSLIKDSLLKTHFLTYDYPFVWENYRLR
jgi:FkbM family methyltransferase